MSPRPRDSVFMRERGIPFKQAPKFRGLMLYAGLERAPAIIDEPWSPLRVSAKLGGGRVKRYWSRYWPLTVGFVLLDAKASGAGFNPVATIAIECDEDFEHVYGDAMLLGWDPTYNETCSIPDNAAKVAVQLFASLQRSIDCSELPPAPPGQLA